MKRLLHFVVCITLSIIFSAVIIKHAECSVTSTKLISCKIDDDCPSNMHCFKRKSYCVSCVNCTLYYRQNGFIRCIKDANYCGQCLPGYGVASEDSLICSQNLDSLPPDAQTMENSVGNIIHSVWLMIGLFCIMVIIMFVGSYSFYHRRNYSDQQLNIELSETNNHVITPPPSYESCVTTVDADRNSVTSVRAFNFRIQESAGDDKQKAVPFLRPAYSTCNCDENRIYNSIRINEDHPPNVENEIPRSVHNDVQSNVGVTSGAQTVERVDSSSYSSTVSDLSVLSSSEEDNVNNDDLSSPPIKRRRQQNDVPDVTTDHDGDGAADNHLELNITIIQECSITADADRL